MTDGTDVSEHEGAGEVAAPRPTRRQLVRGVRDFLIVQAQMDPRGPLPGGVRKAATVQAREIVRRNDLAMSPLAAQRKAKAAGKRARRAGKWPGSDARSDAPFSGVSLDVSATDSREMRYEFPTGIAQAPVPVFASYERSVAGQSLTGGAPDAEGTGSPVPDYTPTLDSDARSDAAPSAEEVA